MKATFTTPGLRCGGCAANVRATLSRTPGVLAVDVALPAKRVEVDFDPAVTSAGQLASVLADAGYPPANAAPPAGTPSESKEVVLL